MIARQDSRNMIITSHAVIYQVAGDKWYQTGVRCQVIIYQV